MLQKKFAHSSFVLIRIEHRPHRSDNPVARVRYCSVRNEEKEIITPYLDPLLRLLAHGAAASEARVSRRVDPSR